MLTNSFSYVHKNGYLGEDTSVYVDGWRQDHQIRQHAPLQFPRSWVPSDGLYAPPPELSGTLSSSQLIGAYQKLRNDKRQRSRAGRVDFISSTAIPQDMVTSASALNLPHQKRNPYHMIHQTDWRPAKVFDDAGAIDGMKMKSKYSAWNFPYQNDTGPASKKRRKRYTSPGEVRIFNTGNYVDL